MMATNLPSPFCATHLINPPSSTRCDTQTAALSPLAPKPRARLPFRDCEAFPSIPLGNLPSRRVPAVTLTIAQSNGLFRLWDRRTGRAANGGCPRGLRQTFARHAERDHLVVTRQTSWLYTATLCQISDTFFLKMSPCLCHCSRRGSFATTSLGIVSVSIIQLINYGGDKKNSASALSYLVTIFCISTRGLGLRLSLVPPSN